MINIVTLLVHLRIEKFRVYKKQNKMNCLNIDNLYKLK